MSKEVVGNYLILKCPYCKAEVQEKIEKSIKKYNPAKCPVCGKEIV